MLGRLAWRRSPDTGPKGMCLATSLSLDYLTWAQGRGWALIGTLSQKITQHRHS